LAGKKTVGALSRMAVLFSVVALLTTGCGGGDRLAGGTGRNGIQGTWTRSFIESSGSVVTCPNSLVVDGIQVDSCVSGETLILRDDGTYAITYPAPKLINGGFETGTYSVSGNVLTLKRLTSTFDANGDNEISTGETTTLNLVTDPANIPGNPQQRVVYTYLLNDQGLSLTPASNPTTDGSGATIVNADGTVNASVPNATSQYVQ
jgi:hypothetical protein